MLVLSRRIGDVISIHTPQGIVRIVVLDADDAKSAQLGIHAPKQVMILRGELQGKHLHFSKSDRPKNTTGSH